MLFDSNQIKYEGKTSKLFVSLFLVSSIIILVIIISILIHPNGFDESNLPSTVTVLATLTLCLLVLMIIFIPILYNNSVILDLNNRTIIINFGFKKIKLSIDKIISVNFTHNPIASTAASLDRLAIHTKYETYYISLKKNREFVDKINKDFLNKSK